MSPEQALSKAIRMRRLEADLSQEQLAEMCDMDQTYLSQIERSRRQPSIKILRKIAAALDIKLSDIFLDAEIREKEAAYKKD
ncbi:MAG: helix-turn-helix transcriptional regulator [Cellvibrionaceae bacterium]